MAEQDEYRCFIGNLSWSTSDRDLEHAFEKFGRLVDAKVVMDKYSGRSRGFGFITFEDRKAMEEAIDAMNGMDLDGRSITVDRASANQGGSGRDRNGDRDHDRGRGDRDRSSRDYGGGGRGSGGDCFKCGKPGHFARECPSGGEESRGGGRYGGGGGGGGSRYGSDRDGDRYGGGRSRDSGSRGNDKYSRDRDRSGPYERPSGGYRS